jgi:rod shape-determining protein MreC
VQLLGAPQSVVATRVGDRGLVGTVAPVPAGGAKGGAGELSLTVLPPGVPRVGDVVRTLGSVDGRPYAAGITVGRVVAVDPDAARGTASGRVAPAVDLEGIDVVAVLVPEIRGERRPLVRGGTGDDGAATPIADSVADRVADRVAELAGDG